MQLIKSIFILALLPIIVFFASCGETCEENLTRTQNVKVHFEDSARNNLANFYPNVYGVGATTNITYTDSISAYLLPLNFNDSTTSFIFANDIVEHTVVFKYKERIDFKDKCRGFEVFIENVEMSYTTFIDYDFNSQSNRLTVRL